MAGQMVHLEIPAGDTAEGTGVLGLALRLAVRGVRGRPGRVPHDPVLRERRVARSTTPTATSAGARVYFDVDDIKTGVARVKELGGEADEAMAVPSMGWFATCTDNGGQRLRSLADRSERRLTELSAKELVAVSN